MIETRFMIRKWVKRVSWIVLTPLLLFVTLMVLLYVPPVQNFLRLQATAYASKATRMQISVGRIDLRFPLNLLVRDVVVIQQPDTLLRLGSLNVHLQAIPLLKGKVEVDDMTLERVFVNSMELIEGMHIWGVLGRLELESHGIDLSNQTALVNRVELSDAHVRLLLNDTTTQQKDTATTVLNWKIILHTLKLKNVSYSMQLPADSMRMATHIGQATVNQVSADLGQQRYQLNTFFLTGSSFRYDVGKASPKSGFDASHMVLRDIRIGIDSVFYQGRNMNAVIRELTANERSGLGITSLTARFHSDSTSLQLPALHLSTPHSEVELSGKTYWELVQIPTTGRLSARLNAVIGKQDVMLFAGSRSDKKGDSQGGLPKAFWDAYPFRPLVVQAGTEGNLKQMQLSGFRIDLPGAFSMRGDGELYHLTDSLRRAAQMDFTLKTGNLNFLTALAGKKPGSSWIIPNHMSLHAHVGMKGPQYNARLLLKEGAGTVNLVAGLNSSTEAYQANLNIDSLGVNHFLPNDSIYALSASLSAHGRGLDILSRRSSAHLKASVRRLNYGQYYVSNIDLSGAIQGGVATAQLTSNNALLRMSAQAQYHLLHHYPDGRVEMNVEDLNLYQLGLIDQPLKHPLAFELMAEVRKERVFTHLRSGDLKLDLNARSGLTPLIRQSTRLVDRLIKQIEYKELDHTALREALPTAILSFSAGKNNPLSWYLDTKQISFGEASVKVGSAPDWGINGKASIHALKVDTLQLDTIFFTVKQDTSRIALHGGIINGPTNPQISFHSTFTGEVRDKDAELTAEYINNKGETGLLFGVNVRPLTGGNGKGNGLAFRLIPSQPILAFHRFSFVDNHDWIYLHNNKRVYANVEMRDAGGVGFRMQSDLKDTVSLQNMNVELHQLRLDELFSMFPYVPQITGLLSAEAHYVQTEQSLELSAEASINELTYEHQRIGDVALGASWLPGDRGKQYVSSYLTLDQEQVMIADGAMYPTASGKDSIVINSTLEHFPVRVANAFVPNQLVTLSGDMDGDLHLTGFIDKPLVNGKLILDEVSVYARQADARFRLDNRPIVVQESRLMFDKFAIFTTGENPFTIDGFIDFRELSQPMANLKMDARNYTLLNAKRTKESLVYGKVFVNFNATVRGALDALVMRGDMNLLGNTNVTYVLMDSPLTVQDRLGDLVTFTSFSDTTALEKEEVPTVSLGGLDMIMNVQIDPAVQLKVDLSADRKSRVELEGGGNLSLKYTPQGDLSLTGRYTLTGGMMKYDLPVIQLEEFKVINGSYVDWTGNPMDPLLNLKATERKRSSVAQESGGSRMVNFDVSIVVKNRLDNLSLAFEIDAPEDATVQNQLASMGPDERSKQALAMLATGIYLADSGKGAGLNMGSALNGVITSQINALTGNMKDASLSFGVEDHNDTDAGGKRTDYSFRYSQRFFNNRFQIVLGGKVSTGANVTYKAESFIDNISLEYRLDTSGTRYVRLFYDKNYESVLEGEIVEAGLGIVLRRKLDRLSELFIFKRKNK